MNRVKDLDVEALIERLFGAELLTVNAGRMAEKEAELLPAGDGRIDVLFRFDEARELLLEDRPGPAVVVAQSIAETYFDEALSALLAVRGAREVVEPVRVAFRQFEISRDAHLKLYAALADDDLRKAPFWEGYLRGRGLRNRWVHARPSQAPSPGSTNVSGDEAEEFILTVVDLVAHLEAALRRAGVPGPTERFSVRFIEQAEKRLEWEVTFISAPDEPIRMRIVPAED